MVERIGGCCGVGWRGRCMSTKLFTGRQSRSLGLTLSPPGIRTMLFEYKSDPFAHVMRHWGSGSFTQLLQPFELLTL
jgi:hypothetical protein